MNLTLTRGFRVRGYRQSSACLMIQRQKSCPHLRHKQLVDLVQSSGFGGVDRYKHKNTDECILRGLSSTQLQPLLCICCLGNVGSLWPFIDELAGSKERRLDLLRVMNLHPWTAVRIIEYMYDEVLRLTCVTL